MEKSLAQFIISQKQFLFDPASPSGKQFAPFRAYVLARLTPGCKKLALPVFKSGVSAYRAALMVALNIPAKTHCMALEDRLIRERLNEIANAPAKR